MRQILIVVATVALCAVAVKAKENVTDPEPASGQPKFDNVDWELSKAMGIMKKYENVVISPTSLRVVLGLLLDAANGTTADEIAKFLQIDAEQLTDKTKIRKHYHELIKSLNRPPDSTLTSDVVTRIFADKTASLNETYLKIVKDNYDTEAEIVDFSKLSDVITKINKWAEGATHGHIIDLLSEADTSADADMLLLNVIFFSGLWTNPFDENRTTTESFYLNDKKYITVPMMKAQHELDYAQTYDSELQLLRMPYQGGSFAMYFILPRSRNGLDDLIDNVTPAKVHSLMKTMTPTTVNVTIPRFKFSYNIGMKPVLEKFGIKTMFTLQADLSNIENRNSSNTLYVTNILQKAGIEVNERGSTAYASTVAEIHNKYGGETTEFKADRPFLFFIEEDKTRTVVFVGKVSNPVLGINGQPPPEINGQPPPQEEEKKEDPFALSYSEASKLSYFDIDLLEVLGNSNIGKNVVISPAGIKTNLGLLLFGASGPTASELQSTLHMSDNATEAEQQALKVQRAITLMTKEFSVKSANALLYSFFLQYYVKQDFQDYATTNFFAYVRAIFNPDPSAAEEEINNWVEKQTEGLIPSAIDPGTIRRDTKLIIINVLYFKAKWLYTFPIEATRPQYFHMYDSKTKCVNMMSMRATLKYNYESDINADVLQIPFQNPNYSFAIILPRRRDGLKSLLRDLKHRSVIDLLHDQDTAEVTLSLPRFKAEFEAELSSALKELRTTTIFSDNANFSNILDLRFVDVKYNISLKLNAVIHRALIDADEQGATAAASTVSTVVPLMSPGKGVDIVADHPFVFFIYNNEMKIILFEGVINKPDTAKNADCSAEKHKTPIKTILDSIYDFDIRQQINNPSANNNSNPIPSTNPESNVNSKPEDRFGASNSTGNQTVKQVEATNNNNKKPNANDLQAVNPATTQRSTTTRRLPTTSILVGEHIQLINKKEQAENINFQKPPAQNSQANPTSNTDNANRIYFPTN